jgi:hypothetical protein
MFKYKGKLYYFCSKMKTLKLLVGGPRHGTVTARNRSVMRTGRKWPMTHAIDKWPVTANLGAISLIAPDKLQTSTCLAHIRAGPPTATPVDLYSVALLYIHPSIRLSYKL